MADSPFVAIGATDLGSTIRQKLNNMGADSEVSFKVASELAEIENELTIFTTGTLVFAISEGKWYKYSGTVWEENNYLPALIYRSVNEITHLDSPFALDGSEVLFCNTNTANITINLPALASNFGRTSKIKNTGTGTVTLDANGTELIGVGGGETFNLSSGESVEIVGSSTRWYIV